MGRASGFKPGVSEEDDLPWYIVGPARQAALAARKDKTTGRISPVVERAMPGNNDFITMYPSKGKREQSRMGSDKNVNVGPGRGTVAMKPSKPAPKMPPRRAVEPRIASKPDGEYVAPSSVESALTAGIQGLPGAQSGMAQEVGSQYGRTTYFGDTPETAAEVAQQMNEPERVRFEDETSKPFWSRFKKGGQVKKKPAKKMAKGGSVSSASKRADGCAQRGKTKGRMV